MQPNADNYILMAFDRTTIESSESELLTTLQLFPFGTLNIGVFEPFLHHDQKFRIGTFDHGVTVSELELLTMVRLKKVSKNHYQWWLNEHGNN